MESASCRFKNGRDGHNGHENQSLVHNSYNGRIEICRRVLVAPKRPAAEERRCSILPDKIDPGYCCDVSGNIGKGSTQRLVTHLGWSAVVQCAFIIPSPTAGNLLRVSRNSCSGQGLVQYRRTTSLCEPSDRTGSRYLPVELRESLQTEPSLTSRGRLRPEHAAFNFFPMIAGSACKCYPLAGRSRAFVS